MTTRGTMTANGKAAIANEATHTPDISGGQHGQS